MGESDAGDGRPSRPSERFTARDRLDREELDRATFIRSITGTLQAMVEEAVERQVSRLLVPFREALDRHMLNEDIHVGKEYAADRTRVSTLWDERNETRGMVKVLGIVAAVAGIAGPIVAVVISKLWP